MGWCIGLVYLPLFAHHIRLRLLCFPVKSVAHGMLYRAYLSLFSRSRLLGATAGIELKRGVLKI